MKRMLICMLLMIGMTSVLVSAEGTEVSRTTGLPTERTYSALAVQVDNDPQARPQINMVQADIIYEIEVGQGGRTRYTAIYNDDIPEMTQAVRGACIVNADVALDWSAALVHFGGQKLAGSNVYDYMESVGLIHYDGMTDSRNFFRDNSRLAPYNVAARLQKIHSAMQEREEETVHTPLIFSESSPTMRGEDVSVFRIPYSKEEGYYPSYEYIQEEGIYRRYYNREDYLDGANGEEYSFSNVIVMYVDYSWYEGAEDRPIVALTGSNRCEYFIGGKHFTGTWSRNSVHESTVYQDEVGVTVRFKPGKTFIQIVNPQIQVEIVK